MPELRLARRKSMTLVSDLVSHFTLDVSFITSGEGSVFTAIYLCVFVCLLVNRITRKVTGEFLRHLVDCGAENC